MNTCTFKFPRCTRLTFLIYLRDVQCVMYTRFCQVLCPVLNPFLLRFARCPLCGWPKGPTPLTVANVAESVNRSLNCSSRSNRRMGSSLRGDVACALYGLRPNPAPMNCLVPIAQWQTPPPPSHFSPPPPRDPGWPWKVVLLLVSLTNLASLRLGQVPKLC